MLLGIRSFDMPDEAAVLPYLNSGSIGGSAEHVFAAKYGVSFAGAFNRIDLLDLVRSVDQKALIDGHHSLPCETHNRSPDLARSMRPSNMTAISRRAALPSGSVANAARAIQHCARRNSSSASTSAGSFSCPIPRWQRSYSATLLSLGSAGWILVSASSFWAFTVLQTASCRNVSFRLRVWAACARVKYSLAHPRYTVGEGITHLEAIRFEQTRVRLCCRRGAAFPGEADHTSERQQLPSRPLGSFRARLRDVSAQVGRQMKQAAALLDIILRGLCCPVALQFCCLGPAPAFRQRKAKFAALTQTVARKP